MYSSAILSITPVYVAILGLLFVMFTLRVGLYRVNKNISMGDGGDPELLRRVRGQGNFIETVPMTLLLLIVMEILGATNVWLHALGAALVVGRIAHYIALTEIGPGVLRPVGMVATLLTAIIAALWILANLFL